MLCCVSFNIKASQTIGNTIVCHDCDSASYKAMAIQKAIDIGFTEDTDPLLPYQGYPEMKPVEVYLYNFEKKEIKRYSVIQQYNPFNREQYAIDELQPSEEIRKEWVNFTLSVEQLLANPFKSTESGYDYLSNLTTRNRVHSKLATQWYQLVLGGSAFFQTLDSFVGIIPNEHIFQRLSITFGDNVIVTLTLKDANKMSLTQILSAEVEYVVDSAYYVNEDGSKIKIPDDLKEASEPMVRGFSSEESLGGFNNYLGFYGFTGNYKSGSFGSKTMSCSTVEVPPQQPDERPKYIMTCKLR